MDASSVGGAGAPPDAAGASSVGGAGAPPDAAGASSAAGAAGAVVFFVVGNITFTLLIISSNFFRAIAFATSSVFLRVAFIFDSTTSCVSFNSSSKDLLMSLIIKIPSLKALSLFRFTLESFCSFLTSFSLYFSVLVSIFSSYNFLSLSNSPLKLSNCFFISLFSSSLFSSSLFSSSLFSLSLLRSIFFESIYL